MTMTTLATDASAKAALAGKTIAVPEGRQLVKFARMLKEQGATTVEVPAVRIVDTTDAAPVEAWLDRLVRGSLDDLVLFTGEGLARLLGFAERGGRREQVVTALGKVRTFTRGPKPAAVLHGLGLHPHVAARVPTTEGLMQALSSEDLAGRNVGLQLYGQQASPALVALIESKGGQVATVAPYVYVDGVDDTAGHELVAKLGSGQIDAIAFTSSIQIKTLFEWAERHRLAGELADGLSRTQIASVGPACSAALAAYGVRVDIAPTKSFFLRPLIEALASGLAPDLPVANLETRPTD